jgi:hypothetical protein
MRMNEAIGTDMRPQKARVGKEAYVLTYTALEGLAVCSLSAGGLGAIAILAPSGSSWILRSIAAVWALLCLWTVRGISRRAWRTFWL